jgi:hypothetical protein
VWYILFFILRQFEWYGIVNFSFYTCSNGVVYCLKMKNKIYHTVRIVIKWKTKYNTPFELSSNEKQNIPHRSKCYKMKIIYTGIFCFSFYDSSNGVVYLVFHFIPVRTVWYILFFTLWQFERFETKYTTPFELSSNEKQNIPHRSNSHQMKNKIYHTVRTVIKWKTKYTTPFKNVIKWKGIFCFSLYDSWTVRYI